MFLEKERILATIKEIVEYREKRKREYKKYGTIKIPLHVLESLGIIGPEPDVDEAPCAFAFILRLHIQDSDLANELLEMYHER